MLKSRSFRRNLNGPVPKTVAHLPRKFYGRVRVGGDTVVPEYYIYIYRNSLHPVRYRVYTRNVARDWTTFDGRGVRIKWTKHSFAMHATRLSKLSVNIGAGGRGKQKVDCSLRCSCCSRRFPLVLIYCFVVIALRA